jgi:hypothetical protein
MPCSCQRTESAGDGADQGSAGQGLDGGRGGGGEGGSEVRGTMELDGGGGGGRGGQPFKLSGFSASSQRA